MTTLAQSNHVNQVKEWLKKFPLLVTVKRNIWSLFDGSSGTTRLNVVDTFPLYQPYSAGSYKNRARLTIEAINQVFPALDSLARYVHNKESAVEDIETFSLDEQSKSSAAALKLVLDSRGSDKANHHNYHHIYGAILRNPRNVKNIFEIGLGTNNSDVVSNMGNRGIPGASLRAFRDYCPHAFVYGADIDERVLFEEDRIKTFFVDQTKPHTFDSIFAKVPPNFDLVIDDGLHSPNANVASLEFALRIVGVGGWAVVEDIGHAAISVWRLVSALLPDRYEPHILSAAGAVVFAVKRLR